MNISNINTTHRKAMELAEDGEFLKRQDEIEFSLIKFYEAFQLEKSAFEQLISSEVEGTTLEPTKSIICQSAMYLSESANKSAEGLILAEYLVNNSPYSECVNNAKEFIKDHS